MKKDVNSCIIPSSYPKLAKHQPFIGVYFYKKNSFLHVGYAIINEDSYIIKCPAKNMALPKAKLGI